jgi:hypothetical protein
MLGNRYSVENAEAGFRGRGAAQLTPDRDYSPKAAKCGAITNR